MMIRGLYKILFTLPECTPDIAGFCQSAPAEDKNISSVIKLKISLFLLIIISLQRIAGQLPYNVEKTIFSSKNYDEFCPVIYRDRIVYCSNIEERLFITYENKEKKSLFNLFSISKYESHWAKKPVVFNRNIITPVNDGPASFSADGSRMVYSRNVDSEVKVKNESDMSNTLGLFFAELTNDEWTNITGFKYNSPEYSISTPCFSPDGRYLYFSSNIPGGFGGTDIFRCELFEGNWSEPENLGDVINTGGSEGYPFVALNGDLYFASDGHGGLGKKDILVTRWKEKGWMTPANLQAPINSENDDFGFIIDSTFSTGYFSSDRDQSDDIYKFTTVSPRLFDCDTLKENQYCFEFWDEKYSGSDSLPVIYEWEFSDGSEIRGLKVEHCFPGAGKYSAKLNIIDSVTSIAFLTQSTLEFEITDFKQPFIASRDFYLSSKEMVFSGLSSNLPGFTIEDYYWDFGDGDLATGAEVSHKYLNPGVYGVKLGVSGFDEGNEIKQTKCVIKTVAIVRDNQALAMYVYGIESAVTDESTVDSGDTSEVSRDVMNSGFTGARVKTYLLAELPDEIVDRVSRDFAELSNANFDFNQSGIAETSYPLLDMIVKIMEENPELAMEIAVHTDNTGSAAYNMQLSQTRAQKIVDYLVSKKIEKERLVARGYGESRPISPSNTEEGRVKNRRLEFIFLNDTP